MNARLPQEAEADLAEALRWYRQRGGTQVANRFTRAVAVAIDLIERYPEGQPILYRTVRRVLVPRVTQALLYSCEADVAVVLGCFHTARDPEIWRSRNDAVLD